MASCGDDDSDFIARGDDSSEEDGSSDSDSDDGSSSSKKGSSSSNTGSSSSHRGPLSSSSLYDVSKIEKGTFIDKRDGHEYRTVTIGGQTWMAQNLNYAPASSLGCHKGDNEDCTKYGRKYTWAEVIDSTRSFCGVREKCSSPLHGICPEGWRIPAEWEWEKLLNKLYGSSPSFNDWDGLAPYLFSKDNDYYEGIDLYGLSIAVPGRYDQAALDFYTTSQWSSGQPDMIRFSYWDVDDYGPAPDTMPASLRCIKGDLMPDINDPEKTFGVRGDDRKVCNGAEVQTIISSQACNKKGVNNCKKNEDGSIYIPGWTRYTTDYTADYGPFDVYFEEKGKKDCPFEWHVPSKSEWETLLYTVGGRCFAGYTLKAQEGWGDDYALDVFAVGIKPTDGDEARFLIGTSKRGELVGSVVFKKGSNIAVFEDDTANTSGLLCVKGRLKEDTLSFTNPNLEYGTFTDSRDGRTYKTIDIGHTKWMAENLNYKTDSSVCYRWERNINSFSCMRYGRYYLYEEALTACPEGWRLPTKEEFDTLMYIGTPYKGARPLVSVENETRKGTNNSGFSLIMMGYVWNDRGSFSDTATYLWSSTKASDSTVYTLSVRKTLYSDTSYVSQVYDNRGSMFNVRCVSEEKVAYGYKGSYGTLVDERDGHEYKTVEINGTTWMAENLKYESSNSTCKNDSCDIYGLHYTYPFATSETNQLCPDGWHVSTTAEWDSMLAYVTGIDSLNYAYDMKYTFIWPAFGAGTDKYGFGMLPNSCYRDNTGYDIVNVKSASVACIGAENPEEDEGYYYIHSTNNVNGVYKEIIKRRINDSKFRYGIRCVKDK